MVLVFRRRGGDGDPPDHRDHANPTVADARVTWLTAPTAETVKRLALVAAILATTIAAVDSTAVNVALPAIRRDLGGGFPAQQWVSNAYLLTLSSLILLAGSLTDRLGERRVFVAGVAGFGIGSLLCAVSSSIGVLIAARALQGVFGALLTPAALAIIVAVFPKDERGAAIGKWTAWGGVGILVGPLIGGQIVDSASWRWIFAINVPFVLIALGLSRVAVPGRTGGAPATRIDWLGAVLAAIGLAGISFGLIEQPVLGWSDPGVWGALAIGVATFTAFLVYERRTDGPMLPLDLFSHRNFSVANAQTFAMYGGIGLLGFFVTIYLQQVAGYSALKSGVTGLVPTAVMFVLSTRMGRLADRYGSRPFLIAGPLLVAAGFGLMQRYGSSVSLFGDVVPALLVFAFGMAMTVAPLTATVLADASEADAGIASAVNYAMARVSALIAVAAVGAVVSSYYGPTLLAKLGHGFPANAEAAVQAASRHTFAPVNAAALPPGDRAVVRQAFASASEETFHLAMGIASGLLVVAAAAGLGLRTERRRVVAACACPAGQMCGAPRALHEECPGPAFDRATAAGKIVAAEVSDPPTRPAGPGLSPTSSSTATLTRADAAPAAPLDGFAMLDSMSNRDTPCTHLDSIHITELPPSVAGCEDCLREGGVWLHLRICLECGHVGCCDDSPGRHASRHAADVAHPIIRSLEPGETWSWCFIDEVAMVIPQVTGATRIPPSPMLA
jgi:EmrB/QacA subfamily drug resistance transporter